MIKFVFASLVFSVMASAAFVGSPVSQTFPQIILTTESAAPVVSKKSYIKGHIKIVSDPAHPSWARSLDLEIKGRGNSTWDFPKKPYRLRLNSPESLVGLPTDRDWILLANYSDKTLMRNILANEISRRLGMDYTPRDQIVELTLNGQKMGTYVLTEDLKISADRVPAVPTDVSGGYLLELDRRRDSLFRFETRRAEPYAVKEPAHPNMAQLYYIQTYLQKTEDTLYSSVFADPLAGYAKYIDVDSFIDWYIVNELLKSADAGNFSSIFFHKGSKQKLKMGPVWDFDIAVGNIAWDVMCGPEGWWIRTRSPWFSRLFQDPAFEARVKTRWNQMKDRSGDLESLMNFIDRTAYSLELSQRRNFEIWDILSVYVWPNRVVAGSYRGEVDAMKEWLRARFQWMDRQLNP